MLSDGARDLIERLVWQDLDSDQLLADWSDMCLAQWSTPMEWCNPGGVASALPGLKA